MYNVALTPKTSKKMGPSVVSQNTRRMEERLKEEAKLSERVHHIKEDIIKCVDLTPIHFLDSF